MARQGYAIGGSLYGDLEKWRMLFILELGPCVKWIKSFNRDKRFGTNTFAAVGAFSFYSVFDISLLGCQGFLKLGLVPQRFRQQVPWPTWIFFPFKRIKSATRDRPFLPELLA